jgi:4-hydroxy-2-oxoheptanedioate aldolase
MVKVPALMTAEVLAGSGVDFAILDCQHGLFGREDLAAVSRLTRCAGVSPLVRTAANDPAEIGWALDIGAAGVIVPGVEGPEDAARAVAACRYPPRGRRSFGPLSTAAAAGSPGEADEQVTCVPLIESVAAVEAIEAICGVEGLGAVFIGHADLSIDLGVPLAFADPGLEQAIAKVVSACARAGVPHGRAAMSGREAAELAAAGTPMVSISTDSALLGSAVAAVLEEARAGADRGEHVGR